MMSRRRLNELFLSVVLLALVSSGSLAQGKQRTCGRLSVIVPHIKSTSKVEVVACSVLLRAPEDDERE
jgi:hypothetical protein